MPAKRTSVGNTSRIKESSSHRLRENPAKWSQEVTEHSDALDLHAGVFASDDPEKIARSLKRSAERSKRRKSSPFRSAMSMLTFYANRAGGNLSARRRRILERAKAALRAQFDKTDR